MKKILSLILVCACITGMAAGCGTGTKDTTPSSGASSAGVSSYEEIPEATTTISFGEKTVISGTGAAEDEEGIVITSAGIYKMTGTLSKGRIRVNAPGQEVQLVLNGVSVTSDKGPALVFESVEKAEILLPRNTNNLLADGENNTIKSALYSTKALTIRGNGALNIVGQQNGLTTQSALTVKSASMRVTAKNTGISSGDVTLDNASLYVEAEENGVYGGDSITAKNSKLTAIGGSVNSYGGLKSAGKVSIEGGTILLTGDVLSLPESMSQNFISFSFSEVQKADVLIGVVKNKERVLTYEPPKDFRTLFYSTPDLQNTKYDVYSGGSTTGNVIDHVYDGVYTFGTKMFTLSANDKNTGE